MTQNITTNEDQPKDSEKRLLFVQDRGKCTEDYARALHRSNAPWSQQKQLHESYS